MPTRNVVLTDQQAHFLEQLVSSGRYQNASEVLREGLRLIQEREHERATRLQTLRDAAAIGVSDIEAGRYTVLDDAEALRSHIAALAKRVNSSH